MRNKKRVLSGGVVVLTVFLVLGVCKPDIDKFCRLLFIARHIGTRFHSLQDRRKK